MELSVLKIIDHFHFSDFKRTIKLTWLFVAIGLILYLIFVLLAFQTPSKSFFYYFLQNIGIFLMLTSLLMAYAGTYQMTTAPGKDRLDALQAVKATLRRAHYIIGVSLLTIISITVVILIEVGISSLGFIPRIGPIILSILTIPFFVINLFCLLFAVCVFAMFPPLVSEVSSFKDIFIEFKISIKERWVSVIIYLFISLSILALSLIVIFYLTGHAAGLTKTIQWNISKSYPKILDSFAKYSYFSDIAARVAPESGGLGFMGSYDLGPFTYGALINYILYFSYVVLFSFVISFPLAVYFSISSIFFGRVKE